MQSQEQYQGIDYMEEIYENLDDIQHSSSQLSSDYTTQEEGKFLSQQNSTTIYEVEVQDEDLHNILEKKSIIALGNNEGTNYPTPPPLHEKLDAENFEKHEEVTTYDEETRVDTLMKLEKGLTTLEDEEPN